MIFRRKEFKKRREISGLTFSNIASALGLKFQSIQAWETGKSQPSPKHIPALAKLLKCKPDDLADYGKCKNDCRKAEIIRDLAERIERQATERFASRVDEIRESLMRTLRTAYPNSADDTLAHLGVLILERQEIDESAIMAEVRELNSSLVGSERTHQPYPASEVKNGE
jgi:transcriptional regulator with XRE-family HTH domain